MTNLKRIIDEKGVQQRWLAEQAGVTEVSMSRYVNGERIPKAPMAIRMADVLGVDVKELYEWDDKHVVGEPEQPETHSVCLDTISRQAAIDTEGLDEEIRCEICRNPMHTSRGCDGNCTYDEKLYEKIMQILDRRIKQLPSAQPERIRGRWIEKPHVHGVAYCSLCDYELHTNDTNFCPNCGADMRGEQDG